MKCRHGHGAMSVCVCVWPCDIGVRLFRALVTVGIYFSRSFGSSRRKLDPSAMVSSMHDGRYGNAWMALAIFLFPVVFSVCVRSSSTHTTLAVVAAGRPFYTTYLHTNCNCTAAALHALRCTARTHPRFTHPITQSVTVNPTQPKPDPFRHSRCPTASPASSIDCCFCCCPSSAQPTSVLSSQFRVCFACAPCTPSTPWHSLPCPLCPAAAP